MYATEPDRDQDDCLNLNGSVSKVGLTINPQRAVANVR